jgi:tetratricopeptide (TPR) repeat protein
LSRTATGRYELHALLRQFVAAKLRQNPAQTQQTQADHCHYFTTFLARREERLRGAQQKETLAEIATDIENIRAAWHWALENGRFAKLEPALDSLWYFYAMYGWFQEGIESFGRAVAALYPVRAGGSPELAALQGRLLAYLGWLFLRQGYYNQARDLLEQSLTCFDPGHADKDMATPLHFLGILAGEVGDLPETKARLQASLAIYRQTNNLWGIAWALSSLAYYLNELGEGEPVLGRELLQESLALYQQIGNQQGIAVALNTLGYITYRQGDYPAARQLFEESLALRRAVGYPAGIAVALINLGHVSAALAEVEPCQQYYHEALKIAAAIHALPLSLAALGGLARPYAHQGQIDRAHQLLHLVLHHPASNKESRERAANLLAQLPPVPVTGRPTAQRADVEQLVKEILRAE